VRILLVEDDETVAEVLSKYLTSQHYIVDLATNGQAGWDLAEAFEYELILLDLMLPKLDGISFCKQLRHKDDRTPILILTAYDSSTNKVAGLDAGADDYVVKPYDLDELLARIRALLRRNSSALPPTIEWEKLHLDPSICEVTYNGQLLRLTSKEYAILELFLRNTHRIFSQSALLDRLWSFDEPPLENTVRAHIKSLRRKLKELGGEDVIETVYGLGYRLREISTVDFLQQSGADNRQKATEDKNLHKDARKNTFATDLVNNSATLATNAHPKPAPIPSELISFWEQSYDKYSDRVTILEKAVKALLEDKLADTEQQQAVREAHTLIGSLGSFGLEDASQLCRQIEQILKREIDRSEIAQLSELVRELRFCLEQSAVMSQTKAFQPMPVDRSRLTPRLLIIDDDRELNRISIAEATIRGIQAEAVTNLSDARKAIAIRKPDVILLDLCFPDSTDDGLALLRELAKEQTPIPVVVFTARENLSDRLEVARLGAHSFLQKPVSPRKVIEAIAQILQQTTAPEAKLLIVDDDPQMLDFLRTLLSPWGFHLTLLEDPRQFWQTLKQTVPDLLILDIEMPDVNGIELCQVVRNDLDWSELPILFLSAHQDAETIDRVFTVGGDDYVNKPIIGSELIARILNRLERTRILRKLTKKEVVFNLTGQSDES
jgi:DNA-binding response OmpR family regulator/HPt (histidine-containing phosphotransfer) domain-containing protein